MDLFYSDTESCNVQIQDVQFHSCILKKYDYFKSHIEFNKISNTKVQEIKLPEEFSDELIVEFKRYCYKQPIGELTPRLSVEIYKLSKILLINMFLHYRNKIQILLNNSNSSDMLYMLRNILDLCIPKNFTIYNVDLLNKNSPVELNLIAYCYELGTGCAEDKKMAFELYKLNWEENKHSNSLYNLAVCYSCGKGCVKDKKMAFELYKLNWKENKNSDSLHNLAYCYEYGKGCAEDGFRII